MLTNKETFEKYEDAVKQQGIIKKFEKENGHKIKHRMMIQLVPVPKEYGIAEDDDRKLIAFEASFDFVDTALYIVIDAEAHKLAGDILLLPQSENAVEPDRQFGDLFMKVLFGSINDQGKFPALILVFLADVGYFTIVP